MAERETVFVEDEGENAVLEFDEPGADDKIERYAQTGEQTFDRSEPLS